MTTALEGGEWSAAHHGRTLPPGKTRYPFYRRLGGPQGLSGLAENLVPTGTRSPTVQPVVSRYTDWATRPTYRSVTVIIIIIIIIVITILLYSCEYFITSVQIICMLNQSHRNVTSKPHIFTTIFVVVNVQITFHTKCVYMFLLVSHRISCAQLQ